MAINADDQESAPVEKPTRKNSYVLKLIGEILIICGAILVAIDWIFILSRQLFFPLYSFLWDVVANPGTADRLFLFLVMPFLLLLTGEIILYLSQKGTRKKGLFGITMVLVYTIFLWIITVFGIFIGTAYYD
jgi:hypothetical protein